MTPICTALPASSGPLARIIHLFLRPDPVAKINPGHPPALFAHAADIARDCNMLPEDVTGMPTWQAGEPFFCQAGFGRD